MLFPAGLATASSEVCKNHPFEVLLLLNDLRNLIEYAQGIGSSTTPIVPLLPISRWISRSVLGRKKRQFVVGKTFLCRLHKRLFLSRGRGHREVVEVKFSR